MKWISEGYGWRSASGVITIQRLAPGMFALRDGDRQVGIYTTARQAKDVMEATNNADRRRKLGGADA